MKSILHESTRDLYTQSQKSEQEPTFTHSEQERAYFEAEEDRWELENLISKFNL